MQAKRKIMIVEDEFIIADKLEELLIGNGYEVLPIKDSYKDSIDLLNKEIPDLALLDIKIKGDKDGIELAAYIYKFFNIPVIFLSAYTDPKTLLRVKAAHPNTFIIKSKPILNKKQLLVAINVALPELSDTNTKAKGFYLEVKEIDFPRKIEGNKKEGWVSERMFLLYDEITYIESYNKSKKNTVLIHSTHKDKAYIFRSTMDDIGNMLPQNFIRVHESYIANLHKITGRRSQQLILEKNLLNIGNTYKDTVNKKIAQLGF